MAFSTSQALSAPGRFMPLGAIRDDVVRGFMMTSRAVVMWFGVIAIAAVTFVFGYSETRERLVSAVTNAATQAVVSAWTAVHGTAHPLTLQASGHLPRLRRPPRGGKYGASTWQKWSRS